ncbi:MAG TPA: PhoH family protein [Candidatus Limnocylindrales bacterium]|nr:PhoH family protein [Candidatus Limnocylindrales bacterium]
MADNVTSRTILLAGGDEAVQLLGTHDRHFALVENKFAVRLIPKGHELNIEGKPEDVEALYAMFQELIAHIRKGHHLTGREFEYALKLTGQGEVGAIRALFSDLLLVTPRGKQIRPKTLGQKRYLEAMRGYDIVLSIGPAGTGKTYLALAMAVDALKNKQVQRLILTRPAIEAGEHLGFLPGDFQEKVDPYLRPIYDGLYDLLGVEAFLNFRERGIVEIAPLAYMRGRTFDDSFVILDEGQNTTPEQMKMFLTRLGFGSKVVITGDVTQTDLPRGRFSGLEEAPRILSGIEGIAFVYLTEKDVVRHPLVQSIIKAYEAYEASGERESHGS